MDAFIKLMLSQKPLHLSSQRVTRTLNHEWRRWFEDDRNKKLLGILGEKFNA